MERALLKLARQLNSYDEASLMALWDTLAERVERFEPSSRWEEAAIAFGMVQAVRWKNQLHNSHMSEMARPDDGLPPLSGYDGDISLFEGASRSGADGPVGGQPAQKRAKILSFRPRESE
ncbi:hypothetical protein Dde_4008 [Oleidesulfovibrio alaskensis G20]|jgi:hypothetical protein|uniref:Uncharacterized protein n=1 Tax=Oleidesulfovibrio alaskensis (strain ATCC BAA-1058 / DSM 17464 / G20) TaxID=207559 RepID=F9XXH6_OLEA2|nr:hypothetical protein [Oleidesulfovibrio alaskensis]AEL79409.1 hypothetical protein Dde_4008 [Oleidesulfovibrio alaskensis G20]MBG0774495.1 hypothetical protein [Oleidesulfovibrio alaskensis]MBL3582797.1 hypothetical protein [Oleidesulfovibrio alaskensis]